MASLAGCFASSVLRQPSVSVSIPGSGEVLIGTVFGSLPTKKKGKRS